MTTLVPKSVVSILLLRRGRGWPGVHETTSRHVTVNSVPATPKEKCWHRLVAASQFFQLIFQVVPTASEGAGIAQWLEHRTRD